MARKARKFIGKKMRREAREYVEWKKIVKQQTTKPIKNSGRGTQLGIHSLPIIGARSQKKFLLIWSK